MAKAKRSGRSDEAFDPAAYVPMGPHRPDSVLRNNGVVSWEPRGGVYCFRSADKYAVAFMLGGSAEDPKKKDTVIVVCRALRPGKAAGGLGKHAVIRRAFTDGESLTRAVERALAGKDGPG